MIKTFRGILADGDQNRIRLSTKKGKIGYRIIKFQMFANLAGQETYETTMKVYKIQQTTVDATVDFSDGNLLAAGYLSARYDVQYSAQVGPVIFDREIFNQDIYITAVDTDSATAMNYYLELETTTLTDNAAAVSTLRDIRLNPEPI